LCWPRANTWSTRSDTTSFEPSLQPENERRIPTQFDETGSTLNDIFRLLYLYKIPFLNKFFLELFKEFAPEN
uniref:Uncharacterized protein n=1 Tax=Toxocara canis TaxID=6265 RepID=A0A183UZB8_TOXCA